MENPHAILPKALANIHQSFLTHHRYKIFWEMHLVHLLFYGGILNAVAFLSLELLPLIRSSTDPFSIWGFRLVAMMLGVSWLWHTFRHYPEKDFGQVSPFMLRSRFLIYVLGLSFVFLPIELMGRSLAISADFILFLFSQLSILLCLAKLTSKKATILGALLSFLAVIFLLLGIVAVSISVQKATWMIFIWLPLSALPYIGLYHGRGALPTIGVMANLILPVGIWHFAFLLYTVLEKQNSWQKDENMLPIILLMVLSYALYFWFMPKLQKSLVKASSLPVRDL